MGLYSLALVAVLHELISDESYMTVAISYLTNKCHVLDDRYICICPSVISTVKEER